MQWPYNHLMLSALKEQVRRSSDVLAAKVDVAAALAARDFREFDRHVYEAQDGVDNDGYWARNDPSRHMHDIVTPFVCLNALDDPICRGHLVPVADFEAHDYGVLVATERGGHCGWYEAGFPAARSWAPRTVALVARAMLAEAAGGEGGDGFPGGPLPG